MDASNARSPALAEHPEFNDFVRAAAVHHGILPALVEKDYWVTRVLRAIADDPAQRGRTLFKGGTSLSKGWKLIDRFSEDIDLLLTGPDFGPMPTAKVRERHFKELRSRIEADTPLRLPNQRDLSRDEWNFHYLRSDKHCNMRYPLPGKQTTLGSASADWLLVESGYRGGVQPHATRPLTSLVAEFLETQSDATTDLTAYSTDMTPFSMDLLRPERTFAEKLLGLHVEMSKGIEGARGVRTRHYYDLAQVFTRSDEVRACVVSGELQGLLRDAAVVSNTHWGTSIDAEALDLRDSPALDPSAEQINLLTAGYENPTERALYYSRWRPFTEILQEVRSIREALR